MNIKNYIFAGVSFLIGAASGGVCAFLVAKKRYERIHQEEMNAVWNDIKNSGKKGIASETESRANEEKHVDASRTSYEKPDLAEYANKIREQGYDPEPLPKTNDFIYEVGYNDLDEDEYERIELTLYADGILADDKDYPIKDVHATVGDHYLDIMHGKDEAFIRNEKMKTDYDICRSMLTFGEMLERHPETEQRLQYNDALDEFYEKKYDEEEEEDEE